MTLSISQAIPSNWRSPIVAELEPNGLFWVDIPGVIRGVPQIGLYRHQLSPERVEEFSDLVFRQRVWDLPDLSVIRPDEPVVSVGRGDGDLLETKVWSMHDLPSELLPVLDAFNRLVDEARASPLRVLAGTACLADTRASPKAHLSFALTLRNVGAEPVVFPNPMTPPRGVTRLRLLVARPSPAPDKPPSGQQRCDIASTFLSCPDRPELRAGGPDELLHLAPGEMIQFFGEPVLYLSPGQHLTALSFDSSPGPGAPSQAISGVLTMEMQTLQVVRDP